MENKSRKPHYSIDGFVQNQRARSVGFGNSTPAPIRGVRMRRPTTHTESSPLTPRLNNTATINTSATTRPLHTTAPTIGFGSPPQREASDIPRQRGRHGRATTPRPKPKGLFGRIRAVRWKKVIKRSVLTLLIIGLGWGGWLGWKIAHDTSKIFGGHGSLLGFLSSAQLKGQSQGRVNILLAGDSADDPGHQGADLTDSIMLLSIDTKNNTAFMLSIPRDLWVNLPDSMGSQKINAANTDSSFSMSGYPSGGMGALEYVVSQTFNVPIDYYALINYTAFRDAVNAVGGVSITINSSDPRGLYDPNTSLKLPNGVVSLTGQEALNLARSRGDGYGSYGFPASDFDRTSYQRQIGLAIKSKVFSTSVLSNPLKIAALFDAIGNNVQTDLNTSDVRTLYSIFKKINNSAIQSIGLNSTTYNGKPDVDLLSNYLSPNGEDALIPAAGLGDYSEFQLLVTQLTSNNPVVKEAANVVVLNGGTIAGLAGKEQTELTGQGIDVSSIGDATTIANTLIVDQSGGKMPATKAALEKTFGTNVTTTNTYGYPSASFIVVLGTNQAAPTSTSTSSTATQ